MPTRSLLCAAMAAVAFGTAPAAHAASYTEDFEAAFPAWENGWFGEHSDAYNYYCTRTCPHRGNNPDGLWLGGVGGAAVVSMIDVHFDAAFGAGITSLSFDLADYVDTTLHVYDSNGVEIFSRAVMAFGNGAVDPGVYANYLIFSSTGISHFTFDGLAAGNTSIDNIHVETAVPEPTSAALLLAGLAAVGGLVRGRRAPAR